MFYSLSPGQLRPSEAIHWLADRKYTDRLIPQLPAWQELRKDLRTGRVPAYVLRNGVSHRAYQDQFASIGDIWWSGLDDRSFLSMETEVLETLMPNPFPPIQIVRISGPLFILEADLDAAYSEPPATLEARCAAYLAGLPPTPRLKKAETRAAFIKKHGDIGARPFNRAWKKSAHPSWRISGAPRK
jgi:hypothetical protein